MGDPVLDQRVRVPGDTLVQIFADEAVILSLRSDRYYSLDDVGTEMWKAITTADTVSGALKRLQSVYDVEPPRLTTDLVRFVQSLAEAQLVELVDAD